MSSILKNPAGTIRLILFSVELLLMEETIETVAEDRIRL